MPERIDSREISIWFFCGILMLAYGLVLIVTGLMEFHTPPPNELLLAWLQPLHPTLWWGAFLALSGGIYTLRFRPHSMPEVK